MLSEENPYDFGVDVSLDEGRAGDTKIAVIRTSDRTQYKRCRRRWNWSSHLRDGLMPIETASPLWAGSGFHYAMEDYHGFRKHKTIIDAFNAYVKATYYQSKASNHNRLPGDWPELTSLIRGMLEYYTEYWLQDRDPLRTFWWEGRPQVEVHIRVPLPIQPPPGYDAVVYDLTIDRIIEDDNGLLWIVDYKTAKKIQSSFFQTDPQISSYCWGASTLYGKPIAGFIYQQHRKDLPEDPRFNISSGKISVSPTLKTTHRHYRRSLINLYGEVLNAPKANVDYLNNLIRDEDENRDMFVQRNRVGRNEHQVRAEGEKIMLEVEEMLNDNLSLYPNPTRDCAWMCPFASPCIDMDDGSDWMDTLNSMFVPKDPEFDSWRRFLPEEYR
jgi:hypothetical protein